MAQFTSKAVETVEQVAERRWAAEGFDHRAAALEIIKTAVELIKGAPVAGVGHRVAHGGTKYAAPIRVDDGVMAAKAR